MRRLGFLVFVLVVLAAGGMLTTLLANGGVDNLLPFLHQTSNPEASTMMAEPWQLEQLFLLVGFILVNLLGIGVTIAIIVWFLNRQVSIVRSSGTNTAAVEAKTEE